MTSFDELPRSFTVYWWSIGGWGQFRNDPKFLLPCLGRRIRLADRDTVRPFPRIGMRTLRSRFSRERVEPNSLSLSRSRIRVFAK